MERLCFLCFFLCFLSFLLSVGSFNYQISDQRWTWYTHCVIPSFSNKWMISGAVFPVRSNLKFFEKRPVRLRLSTGPSESLFNSKISVNVFIGSSLWGPSHQETIRGKADNWTWPKQCGRESIEFSLVQSFHNKTLWRSWEPGMILLKIVRTFFLLLPPV